MKTAVGKFQRPLCVVLFVVLSVFYTVQSLEHDFGVADTGDYSRVSRFLTPGPVGVSQRWDMPEAFEIKRNMRDCWLPYWRLELSPVPPVFSSVILLWLPGLLVNLMFYSTSTLYLPFLSIFPKLLILVSIYLIFRWLINTGKLNIATFAAVTAPLFLIYTDRNYTAYFNTFYQETASLTWLLFFIALFLYLSARPGVSNRGAVAYYAVLFLFSTSKASLIYVPLLSLPMSIALYRKSSVRIRPLQALVLLMFPLVVSFSLGSYGWMRSANTYLSLFNGTLTFSKDPDGHLKRLGLSEARHMIGTRAFTKEARKYRSTMDRRRVSYLSSLSVMVLEPAVFARMMLHAADNMQETSVTRLGKRSSTVQYRLSSPWSTLKRKYFPRGTGLLALLVVSMLFFTVMILLYGKSMGGASAVFTAGLFTSSGVLVDMFIKMFGAGKDGMIKHLIFANALFDLTVVLLLGSMVMVFAHVARRKPAHESSKAA